MDNNNNIHDEYVALATSTESRNFDEIRERVNAVVTLRLLHSAMGMVTEAAELLDMLKKHIYYGRAIDLANVLEEVGDCQWYEAIAADVLGQKNFDNIQQVNIDKLRARYPEKFEYKSALERDLDVERKILERGLVAEPKQISPTCVELEGVCCSHCGVAAMYEAGEGLGLSFTFCNSCNMVTSPVTMQEGQTK